MPNPNDPSGSQRRRPGPSASGRNPAPGQSGKRRTGPVARPKPSDIAPIPGPDDVELEPTGSGIGPAPAASGRRPAPGLSGRRRTGPIPKPDDMELEPAGSGIGPAPAASGRRPAPGLSGRRRVEPEPPVDEDLIASVKQEMSDGFPDAPDDEDETRDEERKSRGRERDRRRAKRTPGFKGRILFGLIGAAVLPGVQIGLYWGEVVAGWKTMLPDGAPTTGPFAMAGGVLFGALLILAFLAAIFGSAKFRAFMVGIALGGALLVGATVYRLNKPAKFVEAPAAAEGEESDAPAAKLLPRPVRMGVYALNPVLFKRIDEAKSLEAERGQLKSDLDAAKDQLTRSQKESMAKIQAAEVKTSEMEQKLQEEQAKADEQKRLAEQAKAELQQKLAEALAQIEELKKAKRPAADKPSGEAENEAEGDEAPAPAEPGADEIPGELEE